jgi:GTP pyrophosphokinase
MNLYIKKFCVHTKARLNHYKELQPLDFAYSLRSGIRNAQTRVNGKLVQLNFELKKYDQIEDYNIRNQKPTLHWLDYVTTSSEKNKIRNVHNREKQKKLPKKEKEIAYRKYDI